MRAPWRRTHARPGRRRRRRRGRCRAAGRRSRDRSRASRRSISCGRLHEGAGVVVHDHASCRSSSRSARATAFTVATAFAPLCVGPAVAAVGGHAPATARRRRVLVVGQDQLAPPPGVASRRADVAARAPPTAARRAAILEGQGHERRAEAEAARAPAPRSQRARGRSAGSRRAPARCRRSPRRRSRRGPRERRVRPVGLVDRPSSPGRCRRASPSFATCLSLPVRDERRSIRGARTRRDPRAAGAARREPAHA